MLPPFYYEQRKKRKQKKIIIFGSVFCIFSGIFIVFLLAPSRPVPVTEVSIPQKNIIIQKNASFRLNSLYVCGHQKTQLLPLPEDLIGKTEAEAKLIYPNRTILKFNENLLEAEEKINTECDNHFLLQLTGNKIIVKKTNSPNEIMIEKPINLSILTKEDINILSSGIFVNSKYELLEILESFQ